MTPDAIPMEGIEVSVRSRTWYRQMDGLRVRMQTGLRGNFITADEIEARGYPPVEETIRSLPGVRIIKAGPFEYDVRFRACEQAPVVFVDGIQVNQPEDGEPLRELKMIHSMDIQAVEIYRGAASVPAEFAGPDAMCGALVIWTKRSG
jgi:outer membrane cobalamin receptor